MTGVLQAVLPGAESELFFIPATHRDGNAAAISPFIT
jgi:hypothetical protein